MELKFYFSLSAFLVGYSFNKVHDYGWWFTVNIGFLAVQIFSPEKKTI